MEPFYLLAFIEYSNDTRSVIKIKISWKKIHKNTCHQA